MGVRCGMREWKSLDWTREMLELNASLQPRGSQGVQKGEREWKNFGCPRAKVGVSGNELLATRSRFLVCRVLGGRTNSRTAKPPWLGFLRLEDLPFLGGNFSKLGKAPHPGVNMA